MTATEKEPKIPISQVLEALDKRNKDFYSTLTEAQQKAFSAWMIMRYASASSKYPEHYLIMVNEFVNVDFSALRNHPELQWKLLAMCGTGTKDFHQWIPPGKKKSKSKVQDALAVMFPGSKSDELQLIETIHTYEELVDMFLQAGYQDKEITDIFE